MNPRIGISYSEEIDPSPYAEAVRASGGEPVLLLPNSVDRTASLDGLLLAGGVDVNPAVYGEMPDPKTETPNDARDSQDLELLRIAKEITLPIFAICRGMQILNVADGGTLFQDITGHQVLTPDKALPAHGAHVEPGSLLDSFLCAQVIQVNSRHHQAVAQIGRSLRVSARAIDGTVEALEDPSIPFCLGVQWHPENMTKHDTLQERLFDKFVESCQR